MRIGNGANPWSRAVGRLLSHAPAACTLPGIARRLAPEFEPQSTFRSASPPASRIARLSLGLLAVLGASLAAAPQAHADLAPPIRVRLARPPHPAEASKAFSDTLIITSLQAGEIGNLRLESDGFKAIAFEAPIAKKLTAQSELRVPFTATVQNADQPLGVFMELDGWPFATYIDLSQHAFELSQHPLPVQKVPDSQVTPFPGVNESLTRPALPPPPPQNAPTEAQRAAQAQQKSGGNPGEAQPTHSRWVRVHGRFVYPRSDGVTIGADGCGVYVYDDDSPFGPELLASVATDAFGYYDVSFYWNPCGIFCDSEPDIYILFEATNSRVEVTNTGGSRYRWQTGTTNDYDGADIDFGWLQPGNPADFPSLHILTDLTRTWRWLQNRGYDCPQVRGVWPDGATGAYYNGDQIHVGVDRQWREDTHSHEFGHHFIGHFATQVSPDYCNGICDSPGPPVSCGHCIWCRETDHDAYSEGWPNWLADILTRSYAGQYGIASQFFRSQESLSTCSGTLDDPLRTEGFLGAVLRDIEDNTQDDHPEFAQGIDALALGEGPILTVADLDAPTTPMGFLNSFKARYPWLNEPLWQTAKNCGYEIDTANPSYATSISSSHALFSSSADPTVDFYWTRATDDCSGTAGYSIVIAGGFVFPDASAEIGNVTSYTTGILAPGTYYFNIRAVDNAGRWSGSYNAYGPFTIRPPEPANLTYYTPGGWTYPLTPRGAADAASNNVPVPATLPGNSPTTYTNLAGINNGESPASANFFGYVYVDDIFNVWVEWAPLPAGWWYYGTNLVPITVPGGRHTYGMRADASDAISETNEYDNVWAHQWVWTPLSIGSGVDVVRSAPSPRLAGAGWVVDGSPFYYNCDGLRLDSEYWWTVAYGYSQNMSEDYDLSLHSPSVGAQDGFGPNLAYSGRLAGCLDAVIANLNTTPYQQYDVGVINWNSGSSNYRVMQTRNNYIAVDDSFPVAFAQDEMLKIWECYIPPDKVGPVSVTVDLADPSQGPVYVGWLDRTFTRGSLASFSYTGATDSYTGRARLDMSIGSAGYYGLVVYRDPKDGTAPLDVTIEESTTPPDYTPYLAAGWYAPLVPRPANDGTYGSVPAPTVLWGDVASTYFNYGFANISPTGDPFLHTLTYLDGTAYWYFDSWPYGAYATALWNWNAAWWIAGGRHTLSVRLDPDNTVEEIYENNNINGQQWVWQPSVLAFATPVSRGAPPDPYGGWTDVTTGEPFYANCDGLRTPLFSPGSGYWGAVALMPGASSDVDLRLHEVAPDAKTGFDNVLTYSNWGVGECDYVVVNFNRTAFRRLDAGIVEFAGGEGYSAEAVTAPYLGSAPVTTGPVTLGPSHIMQLGEVYLGVGTFNVRLENLAGTVDWGLTAHDQSLVYDSKFGSIPGGSSFLNGPGSNEWVTINITAPGFYAVGVWKSSAADLAKSGTYRLSILQPATDVASSPNLPSVTALSDVHPNPFNPRTTVSFDLAREGSARVAVYDAAGRLVRTLVSETRPAGRYEITWDGHDDAGQQVASGVYIVRLEAANASDQRKITLVK